MEGINLAGGDLPIVERVDAAFRGYGAAIRRETDPPIPGEPYVSMAIAKDLCAELMSVDAATITELVDALDGARAEIARLTERYGTPHTAVIGARIDTILAKVRSQ